MLLPALSKAREKARCVNCVSNMKSLGMGNLMYVGDYEDHVTKVGSGTAAPYGIYFTNQLATYLGLPTTNELGYFADATICKIYRCPSAVKGTKTDFPFIAGKGGTNYADNPEMKVSETSCWGIKTGNVRRPSEKLMYIEGECGGAYGSYELHHYNHTPGGNASPLPGASTWHAPTYVPSNLKMNICWVDGHVAPVTELIGCGWSAGALSRPYWRPWQ